MFRSELGLHYVTSDLAVLADGGYASFDVYQTTGRVGNLDECGGR